jgi:hypothetical protein
VQNLQKVLRYADFWDNFPESGLRLITAEVKAGVEPQRIDLLYLRSDGIIIPCELKVGGQELDSHGQLIRYIADLSGQSITREWVCAKRRDYLARVHCARPQSEQNIKIDLSVFEEKIAPIPDADFKISNGTGIIMDEGFPRPLVSAVRYLNTAYQMAIRLIELKAFVEDTWNPALEEFIMRIDLHELDVGSVSA